jgi:ADP-ribose pyrophosphatase
LREEVVGSDRIYEGKILNLRVDRVRLSGGRESTREVVEHGNAVTILPVDDTGRLVLVRQYRLPARAILLEAPAGNMDQGETPEETAHRELREETGLGCRELTPLMNFYPAPGFSEEFMYSFLATGLFEAAASPDDDEEVEVVRFSVESALEAIQSGEVIDAKTIVAVLAYRLRLAADA